jgi:ATP-dependent RNA/DNA helicase IGHMBP2
MEYFKALQDLLKVERDEDFKHYQALTEKIPVVLRRSNGLTWYPIAIRNTELSRGDYMNVEFERTTHHDVNHQFRFGAMVALFSNHDPSERLEGTITHVSGNRCKISFRVDELPDWSRDGKLGLDLLFDNNSYNEMERALKEAGDVINGPQASTDNLVALLTGVRKPVFETATYTYPIPSLNNKQQEAVQKILAAKDLVIVHGPPGTGKTTTIVEAIRAMLKKDGKQILVGAPSNTAVDLLTEKLSANGVNVLRIGNPSRVSDALQSLTLDHRISAHAEKKEIKSLRKQASEYKNMAHKYKRSFGRAEQEQRKALFAEAHKIMKEVEQHEQYITEQIINAAEVITCTLVSANHYTIRHRKFETVFIDEAGQALEPACWIPILKAKKLVLAGDHCQLPPTIKSREASSRGLSTTLMEKAAALFPESLTLLEEQYRMHTNIMNFSSRVFYSNKLVANAGVAIQTLFSGDQPFQFIDTSGCGFDERQEESSISNHEEASFVLKHLKLYLEELLPYYDAETFPSIGIISPYQEQVKTIKPLIEEDALLAPFLKNITVNTIDSFQGQERDIVYISLTRSNAEQQIGFLSDIRRMNVAMTRARKKLVIIGDGSTLSKSDFYMGLMNYAEELESYQSAWLYMTD